MGFDLKDYPPRWQQISDEVKKRAFFQCECEGECGLHRAAERGGPRRCTERGGFPALYAKGKVVLTVAHLCHDTKCDDRTHLKAMCQRCHLRYDQLLHERNRRARVDAETGQAGLALGDKPQIYRPEAPVSVRHG